MPISEVGRVRTGRAIALATGLAAAATAYATAAQTGKPGAVQLERLDRGLVAVPAQGGGVLVSWRLLATDPARTAFDVFRNGRKVNPRPVSTSTNFVDRSGATGAVYSVRASGRARGRAEAAVPVWSQGYLTVPLQQPAGGTTPDGVAYTYTANDASVGDLDGDGRYEIVLKWDPTNSRDNAFPGYSGPVLIDAYTLSGQRLWRIDLGRNIRAGAHYTQFLVHDFDGDGRAEMAVRTSDGTVDGQGKVIGDPRADWRGKEGEIPQRDRTGAVTRSDGTMVAPRIGRILSGPEYLTVFDGRTGRALASAPYAPQRHPATSSPTPEQLTELWGDGYANRSDRFLGGVAYLDGQRPSIVMGRGYYGRSTIAAWDYRNGRLTPRWFFDSNQAPEGFGGQGNHQFSVADVDADGRHEIVYGSMVVDDDGQPLWTAKLHHGDAMHVSDLDPTRPGLERWGVHESPSRNGGVGAAMLDARTGAVLWSTQAPNDTGRGVAMDIDPRHPGAEAWGSNSDNLYDARGRVIGSQRPRQMNFAVWWDGDLLRELLDRNQVSKWNWTTGEVTPLLTAVGATTNNGTKSNPALAADILGDWREEVIFRAEDNKALRVYATPYLTEHRMVTLMHDPQYRAQVAGQQMAYNQPSWPGFFIGEGMKDQPRLNPSAR